MALGYTGETPYDQKINRIKRRMGDKGGNQNLKQRLNKVRGTRRDWKREQIAGQQSQQAPQQDNPPLPWSAQYESAIGQANRDLDFSNLSLGQQEQMTRQAYGFDDTSNPYSRAALLQRQYQQNRNQTLNSYASQGQLYAGSLSNARNIDRSNFEQTWDTEKRDYLSRLQDIENQKLAAQRTRDEAIAAAEAQRLEDAIQEPPEPATSPPEESGGGGGRGKHKHKDKHKKKGKK